MKRKKFFSIVMCIIMVISFCTIFPEETIVHFGADAATSTNLSISDKGVQLICSLEGFNKYCYRDNTQSSIGYGTKCTGSSQQPHTAGAHSITEAQAMSDMKSQLKSTYEPRVRNQTSGLQMTQNQFDALVSLCYNTGGGTDIILESPLVQYLKGKITASEAKSEYAKYYITSGGTVLQGLINRRKREAEYFFSSAEVVSSFTASPSSIVINSTQNEKPSVTFTAKNYDIGRFEVSSSSIVDYTITEGFTAISDGAYITLTFTGKSEGNEDFVVYVRDSNDKVVATTKVNITVVRDKESFELSASSVTLNRSKNETKTVRLTALNYTDIGGFYCYVDGDFVNLTSGGFQPLSNGAYMDVTIAGTKNGTGTFYARLYDSNEKTLKELSIPVTVTQDKVTFNASSTNITINRSKDETKIITFTDNSPDDVTIEVASDYEERPIIAGTFNIGYTTHEHTLSIYGVRAGYQNLIVNLLNKKTGELLGSVTLDISVTNDSFSLTKPDSPIQLELSESKTVYFDYQNTPARFVDITVQPYHDDGTCSYTVGTFSGDWQSGSIPLTITGTGIGSELLVVQLIDSETKEYIEGMLLHVIVSKEQTITFDAQGGFVFEDSKTIKCGEAYGVLPEPFQTGYSFIGWYTKKDGGDLITDETIFNLMQDQTLYAHWNANTYSVFLDARGGSVSTDAFSVTYGFGYDDMLPTPTRAGYIFDGWYTDVTDGKEITNSNIVSITDSITLYAHWIAETYTVTFIDNVSSSSDSKSVTYGEAYGVLPSPTRKGYEFIGWYTEEDEGNEITEDTIVKALSDHTLYAHWEKAGLAGDCNNDGEFTVADVVMLQKWLLNAGDLISWKNADLLEDGVIDVFDLAVMKRMLIYG